MFSQQNSRQGMVFVEAVTTVKLMDSSHSHINVLKAWLDQTGVVSACCFERHT